MDDDTQDELEDRVQDEVGEYLADVQPRLDPDDPRNQVRRSGCVLLLALPLLAGYWWLG